MNEWKKDINNEDRGELTGDLGLAVKGMRTEPPPSDARQRVVDAAASWTPASIAERSRRRMPLVIAVLVAASLLLAVSVGIYLATLVDRAKQVAVNTGPQMVQVDESAKSGSVADDSASASPDDDGRPWVNSTQNNASPGTTQARQADSYPSDWDGATPRRVVKLSKEQVEQLAWGKEIHGLRAALLFEPQKNVVAMGDMLKQSYVVRNAGATPLELTATTWVSTTVEVVDQDGKAIAVEGVVEDGRMPFDTWTLRPGEAVKLPLRDMSIGAGEFEDDDLFPHILKATPGQTCRLRGWVSIRRVALADGDDADESEGFSFWTGVVEFRVTDQDDTTAMPRSPSP